MVKRALGWSAAGAERSRGNRVWGGFLHFYASALKCEANIEKLAPERHSLIDSASYKTKIIDPL